MELNTFPEKQPFSMLKILYRTFQHSETSVRSVRDYGPHPDRLDETA